MPWEIDYALLTFQQLKRSKYYLPDDVTITINSALNLSSFLINWNESKLPKEYFIEKYKTLSILLNDYNHIVYLFLKQNYNNINIINLFNYLTDTNSDKLFNNNINKFINLDIIYESNMLILKFSNDNIITLKLIYSSDMITNNIPVIYQIVLTNYI